MSITHRFFSRLRLPIGLILIPGGMVQPHLPEAGAQEFSEQTVAAGVDYLQNEAKPFYRGPYWQVIITGGVAAGDYDGDGWVDLIVTRLEEPPILFRNRGDAAIGTFEDATAAALLDRVQPVGSNGAGWGDIDNDGDLDLYVTSFEGLRYYLYINNGKGQFSEEAVARGAALDDDSPHFGNSVAFGDYDRDGYLDIFVTEWRHDDAVQNPNGVPSHNRLLRNLGTANPGHFVDLTVEAGVGIDAIMGDRGRGSWGFTPRFSDLDGDGYADLAIAADFEESVLFWNNGDGTFTNGTAEVGVGTENNGMGAAIGDFNGDGLLDWFVTAIFKLEDPEFTGNRLYLNNGDRTFTDATDLARVRRGHWGWGASGFDYDNDGDLDLIMTNGWQIEDGFEDNPMVLWKNNGKGVFSDSTGRTGIDNDGFGRGVLTFDYDRDGDLDVFVTNSNGHPVLYRNDIDNGNHWLRIRTIGTLSNREGIGAFITLTPDLDDPEARIVREIDGGSNFLSQSETTAHFGLGNRKDPVDRITIRWPSGVLQVFKTVPVDAVLEAVEPAEAFLFFANAVPLEEGWIFTDWFGSIFTLNFPWIFHPDHKWLFCAGNGGDNIWLWDGRLEWLWTSPETYPFFYSLSRKSWLWYAQGSSNPRSFFDFKAGFWITSD